MKPLVSLIIVTLIALLLGLLDLLDLLNLLSGLKSYAAEGVSEGQVDVTLHGVDVMILSGVTHCDDAQCVSVTLL